MFGSPEDALDGQLRTVTDDEFFDALAEMPPLIDAETGAEVDVTEGVRDERQRH